MTSLRGKLVRLAHAKPELREALLPLISKEAQKKVQVINIETGRKVMVSPATLRDPAKSSKYRKLKQSEKKKKTKKKKTEEKKKTFKKTYTKPVEKVMNKHGLTDEDATEVREFKGDKPTTGKFVSPAELLKRFLAKAKPETKERFMKAPKVSPAEFVEMLGAIMDEEEG